MRIARLFGAICALLGGVLIVGGTADVAGAARVQLIQDSGFETPLVPKGGFATYAVGSTVGSWKVIGASGNVGIVSSSYRGDGITFDAHRSQQYMDLTGLSNTKTGISQIVHTVVGRTFTLGFYSGNTYDPRGAFGTTSTINVYVGLRKVLTTVSTTANPSKQVWKHYSVNFKATSAITAVSFINGDPPTDNNNGLDSVTLRAAS